MGLDGTGAVTGLDAENAIVAMPAMGVMPLRFLRVTGLGQVLWLEDPAAATLFKTAECAERALSWLQPGAYVRLRHREPALRQAA
jgi:hypothetical protein